MEYLKVALPKGRLAEDVIGIFNKAGIPIDVNTKTRKLILKDSKSKFEIMFVKPSDVVTYVNEGACDIGVVGKDTLIESKLDVYELLDLKIGTCKMVVASLEDTNLDDIEELVVASKYPTIAKEYFKSIGRQVRLVKLNGSVELGPLVNLSDCIVDIYETGKTLKANGLKVDADIMNLSARLIVNKQSYRRYKKRIKDIVNKIKESGGIDA
jgi:ATP phosphoribosyltransferase